jgi:hypothetical protein
VKIALATTTVHVPHALKLMRKCSADVRFFVAGDNKTPHAEVADLCAEIGAEYFTMTAQKKWKCSKAIGWNTLARRNIAFLEALQWGADVIYSWDNDNLPVDNYHFFNIQNLFDVDRVAMMFPKAPFNGIKVTGTDGWFDPGRLLIPPTRHRGFPYDKPLSKTAHPITNAKVGVAAGLVIGNPDCDAVTRMEHRPDIGQVHILGSTGVVVDPHTWTIWNSQNTAVIRELIPSWFMAPGCGRHDDIFGSLIVQRVMRERGYHAHFGLPFTFQERNSHDLLVDLRAEIDGMGSVVKMAELLDSIPLPLKSVIDDTRIIYNALAHAEWYPKQAVIAAMAYLNDCESVL